MIKFNDGTGKNMKEHNPKWPQISHYLYRILINDGSGSEKQMLYLI